MAEHSSSCVFLLIPFAGRAGQARAWLGSASPCYGPLSILKFPALEGAWKSTEGWEYPGNEWWGLGWFRLNFCF